MEEIASFNWHALVDMAISLVAAFLFGSVIGLERQVRQRTAGLRTNTLVYVGAAIFVALSVLTLAGDAYAVHGEFGPGDTADSPTLPGLAVDVAAVFAAGRR